MGNNSSDASAPEPADVDLYMRRDIAGGDAAPSECYGAAGAQYSGARSSSSRGDSRAADGDAKHGATRANAQGVEMLRQGHYEEAVKQFKVALIYEPSSVQILNNIGLAYAKMQNFGSAYEWYEKAFKQDTADVETLFSLAWVERKRQRHFHARELFQKVLDMQPEHVKALYLLGDILKTAHEYEGAVRQFERLVRLDKSSIDGHVSLAQCYEHLKQHTRAVQLYNHVLQLAPGRLDVEFLLGRVHYLAKQYRQAITHLDRVPDTDPRAFEARTCSAKSYRELEDHPHAIAQAELAAQLRPHPEVMHFLGEEYLKGEDHADQHKAAHWFNRALDLDPNHVPSRMELGQLMYRQSRWQEAETHLSRLCELDKGNVAAKRSLAHTMYKLRNYDSCKRCCDEALRLEPLNVDVLWLLAELHRHGSTSDERWFLGLWTPTDVSVADVCQTIAKAYLARKQANESLYWLQKVQHYLPSEARVREALRILTKQGSTFNPQDVIDVLEQKAAAACPPESGMAAPPPYLNAQPKKRSGADEKGGGDAKYPSGYPDMAADRKAMRPVDPAQAPPSGNPDDLEWLLRRAERTSSARSAGGGTGGAASCEVWHEVLASSRAILRKRPGDALALRCAAKALLSTGGDSSEIKDYAHRAVESSKETPGFTLGYELHAHLAAACESDRDLAGAEQHFIAALSSKPGDETAMLGLARTLVLRKEMAKAKQLYEQILVSSPNCAESHLKLAEIAFEASEYSDAYRLALKASKLSPSEAPALIVLGHVCAKTSRYEEAMRALSEGLALQPTDVAAMQTYADLLRKVGRNQDAISWFKRSLDIRPGDYDCSLSLAQLHAARGAAGASQAIQHFRAALQCRPSSSEAAEIYLQLAAAQCGVGLWKEAQQALENAVCDLPDATDVWRKLLEVYQQQQDVKGQQQCHRRLVQLNGMTVSTRVSYGELLLLEGQVREAKEQFELALRCDPGNIGALMKLAASWRQDSSREGHLEEARRCFEQVLQLSPANVEALEGAAYCHRKANSLDQAILLYQQCLRVKSTAEGPLYYLGDILYRQHRHAECQLYLQRLVDTNCSAEYKTGALYLLAKSHVSLDEYEEAERHARAGLLLKPKHPHFLFILALVKNRMEDYDTSITTLRQALQYCDAAESDQLRVEIHDWLAQAYERKHEYAPAMEELDHALQMDPSHVSSLITRGLVHIQLKQLSQAETAFRRALAVEKNHALALVRLGYCKLMDNNHQEATQLFQRALQQRCGTVALPRSVKGSARVYMALSLMGQQDVDGALYQLAEARKSHSNFNRICSSGKDVIVRGECEGLVNQLRSISDLDVNASQAWQLVHLMAKGLEFDLRDSALSVQGTTGGPGPTPAASPSAVAGLAHGAHPAGRAGKGGELSTTPEAASSQTTTAASFDQSAGPLVQRQWAAAPGAKQSQPIQASVPGVSVPDEGLAQGQRHLKFELHEQIAYSQLTQNECLGAGGFGAVYRGVFEGREVAIKKLFCEDDGNISPLQLEELEMEVAALRNLNHPRLVSFIGVCLQHPNLCIVTEYMPGGSLHNLLHKVKTPLTLGQQAKMALQVCEGVAFLHNSAPPVVHRDLKSLNIVLDRIYNAKICDFGLTQSMEKTHISLKEGGNGGSPRYMAPECYDSKGKITEKVDVWALGCILVEIFGGPVPYDDCTAVQQIVAKLLVDKQVPYIPHTLPSGVRAIVAECFHLDIERRTHARAVHSRLQLLHLA